MINLNLNNIKPGYISIHGHSGCPIAVYRHPEEDEKILSYITKNVGQIGFVLWVPLSDPAPKYIMRVLECYGSPKPCEIGKEISANISSWNAESGYIYESSTENYEEILDKIGFPLGVMKYVNYCDTVGVFEKCLPPFRKFRVIYEGAYQEIVKRNAMFLIDMINYAKRAFELDITHVHPTLTLLLKIHPVELDDDELPNDCSQSSHTIIFASNGIYIENTADYYGGHHYSEFVVIYRNRLKIKKYEYEAGGCDCGLPGRQHRYECETIREDGKIIDEKCTDE